MNQSSYVIITEAPKMEYLHDYATLPRNYGSKAYFNRPDVKAIRDTVIKNLDDLDANTGFTKELANNRRVLIKPNLVFVFNRMGFKDENYPESTDPRVFEAVISYLCRYTKNIVIIESSGEGMPTSLSFKLSGLDRVARHYGIKCQPLEMEPVVRYMVPQAEVMKEVYLPRILDEVVRGEAFYVSVPKMKTNLFTGVTLGFKNAMGTLPYKLRQRNHTYQINKKLVDLLYLFKPDLAVIDGIVGGEGNTPAPVDPVDTRVIISGNNAVEVDRVATRMMGIDPEKNKLMVEAVKKGFNDPKVTVIGTQKIVPFRPANNSVIDAQFQHDFPNVKVLVGYHDMNNAPKIKDIHKVTPEMVGAIEQVCDGGCLPCAKTTFELMKYIPDLDKSFEFALIMGNGTIVDGKTYYFDPSGKAYDIEDIKALTMTKATLGACTAEIKPFCEINGEGCCFPNNCTATIFKASGRTLSLQSSKNKHFLSLVIEAIRLTNHRKAIIKSGQWIDCPYEQLDKIYELPPLTDEQKKQRYIPWPLPPMTEEQKKKLIADITV
jgi:uncharacterized protein (DUF362 family)